VDIWLLDLDYSLSGSYPRETDETVIAMFYIFKTETTPAVGVTFCNKTRLFLPKIVV